MKIENLLKRVDELLEQAQGVLGTRYSAQIGGTYVNSALMAGFRSASLSFLKSTFGESHPYYQEFLKQTVSNHFVNAEKGHAILYAARFEISGGWLYSLKGLIAAELFSDFLDMADHLLVTGYKGPAGVMAGCVLEEHIRQLCLKQGFEVQDTRDDREVPKKADRLNSELGRAGVYSKLDQKLITAWLDLRNKAAHGKFDEFSNDQVSQMILGITEFMTRVPV